MNPEFNWVTEKLLDYFSRAKNKLVTIMNLFKVNMFNEKIFIFLWFWFALVAVLSVWSLAKWIYRLLNDNNHQMYLEDLLVSKDNGDDGELLLVINASLIFRIIFVGSYVKMLGMNWLYSSHWHSFFHHNMRWIKNGFHGRPTFPQQLKTGKSSTASISTETASFYWGW